jgi:hypothetical protein
MSTLFPSFPISVSVKTASFTIPFNRFARVTVEVDSGGIFTINGVTAVTSAAFLNIDVSITNAEATYNVPTGYRAVIASMGGFFSGENYFNGNSLASYPNNAGQSANVAGAQIGPGGQAIATGGGTRQIAGVAIPSNATNRQAVFMLPPGTVISGSGNWRAVVEEYA